MKARTVKPPCERHQDTLSRLIGKVESKKLRFSLDYRLNAVLESTLRKLKRDMLKLQSFERSKSCSKPKLFRQNLISLSVNRAESEIQNGDCSSPPSVSVTSHPAGQNRFQADCYEESSVHDHKDHLGIEEFFKRLKTNGGSSESRCLDEPITSRLTISLSCLFVSCPSFKNSLIKRNDFGWMT